MTLETQLSKHITTFLKNTHQVEVQDFDFQLTRKEFEGDLTLVVFPLLKHIKTNPVQLGEQIGEHLVKASETISAFNVVKGFLNLSLSETYFSKLIQDIHQDKNFGFKEVTPESHKVMVEYSSPNTNKPLHLGHVRNNLLGFSVAEIQKAAGKQVYKTQIINDRGIHICKSMVAWQKFGDGETPENSGVKGDHLVGKYYVEFDKAYKAEIKELVQQGTAEQQAKKQTPIFIEAQDMLKKWEAGDEETVALWSKMNNWVYEGFEKTYKELGVDFDKNYYESETYLLGKDHIKEGLERGVFYKKDDGSVWIDLSDEGLDEKIVLRSDGTAVYMTQDIGTAIQRITDYDIDEMVYTVGNEQDYHFKVLFLILKKLGFKWADNLYHLSYGMVDLPSGKMKSREGNVVDADDLIDEMIETARTISQELGKLEGYDEAEKNQLYKMIGLGALKYFILKVDPKKRILFDPKESVDFQGNTGPFIQYTYARIQSILRKANTEADSLDVTNYNFDDKEKSLIKQLNEFPGIIQQAADQYSPALVANYVYDLVKEFNSFYQNISILGADDSNQIHFRVELARIVGEVIKKSFAVLGIEVPQRM
ncbi:arginine--tRNA ligase [Psychroflexus tropicus]|uniref:arginine--tRNA ligase n=1 Tax=Psychroflexus tropicus TaxID=197345 RepID=UPI000361FAE1|nr:arginine--tRNA ligase [Psychroflexus tropicus]